MHEKYAYVPRFLCVRRGVLSSHRVACTTFANVGTRNVKKKNYECARSLQQGLMDQRDCIHLSSHHCSSFHSPCCGSCHFPDCHQSVEDEDEACEQLTFPFQLCHSRSDRNFSSNGHCRSRSFSGMQGFTRELLVENPLDLSFALDVVHHRVSAQDCFHTLIAVSMLPRVICQQMQDSPGHNNILLSSHGQFGRLGTLHLPAIGAQWNLSRVSLLVSRLLSRYRTGQTLSQIEIILFYSSEGIRHTPHGQ